MGIYINPRDMTKEEWLEKNYVGQLQAAPVTCPVGEENMLICWVHNGGFTAAAVCDTQHELDAFLYHEDKRMKRWFLVPRAKLKELPGLEHL